jgi:hypothetical protein
VRVQNNGEENRNETETTAKENVMDPSKRLFWWKPGQNKPRTPSKTYETYLRLLSLIDAAAGLLCTSRVHTDAVP